MVGGPPFDCYIRSFFSFFFLKWKNDLFLLSLTFPPLVRPGRSASDPDSEAEQLRSPSPSSANTEGREEEEAIPPAMEERALPTLLPSRRRCWCRWSWPSETDWVMVEPPEPDGADGWGGRLLGAAEAAEAGPSTTAAAAEAAADWMDPPASWLKLLTILLRLAARSGELVFAREEAGGVEARASWLCGWWWWWWWRGS